MYSPEGRPPHEPPGLFGAYGLVFLLGVTLVAARMSAPWVALLAGSLLLVGLLARLWARYCLAGLVYTRWRAQSDRGGAASGLPGSLAVGRDVAGGSQRAVGRVLGGEGPVAEGALRGGEAAVGRVLRGDGAAAVRAFCGDVLVLETRLSNRKLLPLPWVEAWERLPAALDPGGELVESLERRGHVWLCQGASLWPYQRARWEHRLECRHRGAFTLGAVRVRAGDPFGLGEREAWLPGALDVIVYPRVVPLRRLGLPLRHPAVDVASRRSLMADPTRTAWVRDYQPGDPQRLIHWPATAHRGALQVRVLEPATTLQVSLVLDPVAFDVVLSMYRDTLFELAVSALASVAVHLSAAGHSVGLVTTTRPAAALPPSANPAQLQTLLEHLARVEPERGLRRHAVGLGSQGAGASGPAGGGGQAAGDGGQADMAAGSAGLTDGGQGAASRGPGWGGGARLAFPIPRGSAVVLATSDLALDLAETVGVLEQAGHQVVVLLATSGVRAPSVAADRVVRLLPTADLAAVLEGQVGAAIGGGGR